jgi:pimeloyl-ACP methyl ester carboxylesterase
VSRGSRPSAPANPLRSVDARIVALRIGFQVLGPLFPGRAAAIAERLFTRPPHHAVRPAEEAFLATGQAFTVPHEGLELACWRWGAGGPVVLLMHGWGSRAGRFRHFIPSLLDRGFQVVALDGPGHGRTGGTSASLPQFAAALTEVATVAGPVRAFIGHSLGGAAILFAMSRQLPPAPAVIIAAPSDPSLYWRRFVRHLHIPRRVRDLLQQSLERRFSITWNDLHLVPIAAAHPAPLLVIHDDDDEDVPPENGYDLAEAAPQGTFVLTEGLGHRSIMRDATVVRRSVDFVAEWVPR